jgi:hypothetical protein
MEKKDSKLGKLLDVMKGAYSQMFAGTIAL